jgi:hypothetical protein
MGPPGHTSLPSTSQNIPFLTPSRKPLPTHPISSTSTLLYLGHQRAPWSQQFPQTPPGPDLPQVRAGRVLPSSPCLQHILVSYPGTRVIPDHLIMSEERFCIDLFNSPTLTPSRSSVGTYSEPTSQAAGDYPLLILHHLGCHLG